MYIYIYRCVYITRLSVYNKADSRQHRHRHQIRELVIRKNSKESRAYIKMIQRLGMRRAYKSWDEKGVFAFDIDAELGFRNASLAPR